MPLSYGFILTFFFFCCYTNSLMWSWKKGFSFFFSFSSCLCSLILLAILTKRVSFSYTHKRFIQQFDFAFLHMIFTLSIALTYLEKHILESEAGIALRVIQYELKRRVAQTLTFGRHCWLAFSSSSSTSNIRYILSNFQWWWWFSLHLIFYATACHIKLLK